MFIQGAVLHCTAREPRGPWCCPAARGIACSPARLPDSDPAGMSLPWLNNEAQSERASQTGAGDVAPLLVSLHPALPSLQPFHVALCF